MTDFADDWIRKHESIDSKICHALGFINIVWNACEHGLLPLFRAVTNLRGQEAFILTHDMGDVTLTNKIREFLPLRKDFLPAEKLMILSALEGYDVNRVNRNQLSHFSPVPSGSVLSVGKDLQFYRRKGPRFLADAIPSDLTSIRRVADDLVMLAAYLGALNRYLHGKHEKLPPMPMPGKLPLPERLWTPPPPNPQGRKRPPGNSPG
jgi:hypothetical protein